MGKHAARTEHYSPALTWAHPHPTDPENTIGERCTLYADAPPSADVDALGLRAWFACTDCKRLRPTPKGTGSGNYCGGTGYGRHDDDPRSVVCYACCAERDKRTMRETGRATLYLTPQTVPADWRDRLGTVGRADAARAGWKLSNWPGTLTLPLLSASTGRHNWRNVVRVDCWFVFEGFVWHGVRLGDSDIARCKRTRTAWVDLGNGRGWGPRTPRKSRAKVAQPAGGIPVGTPTESDKLARGIMPERIDGRTHGPGR
jgi:hypothetical protein